MIWFVGSERNFALILFPFWSRTKHTILFLCNLSETAVPWFCFLTMKYNVVFERIAIKKFLNPQWKNIVQTIMLTFGGIFIYMKYIFLLITSNQHVLHNNAAFEFPAQLAGIWNSFEALDSWDSPIQAKRSGWERLRVWKMKMSLAWNQCVWYFLNRREHPHGSSTKSCWQVANCFCKCKQAMVPTHSGARLRRVIEHKGLAQPDNPSSFPVFHDLQSKCCSQWTFPKWSWFCTVGALAKLTCSCLTFSQVVLGAIWAQRGND